MSGNFVAETLGCKVRKLLSDNLYIKNFIIILMLYFIVIFTVEKNRHPIENMKLSIFLWIVFLLFNKTKLEFTVISLIIDFNFSKQKLYGLL